MKEKVIMNGYLSFFVILSILIFNTPIFASETETTYNFSPKAIENVPDIVQKANSANINDRIDILKRLIYKPIGSDAPILHFSLDLPDEDYITAAKCVLELDPQTKTYQKTNEIYEIFCRITFITIELKAEELLPQIIKFINNELKVVQLLTLKILEELNAKQYSKEIIRKGYDPDMEMSRRAEQILADFNSKEAVPLFISCLNDENQAKRMIAIEALGKIADPNAIPHLVQMLKTELSWQAINALVQMNAKESVPFIKELYKSNKLKNSRVLVSLVYFGDEEAISDIMAKIVGSDNVYYESYLESLMEINAKPIIPDLIKALEDEKIIGGQSNRGPNLVCYMMITLAKMNATEAIPVLKRYLNLQPVPSKTDNVVERTSIEALGILKAKEAIPDLILRIESEAHYSGIRSEAIMALAMIGEPSTIKNIIKQKNYVGREVLCQLAYTFNPDIYNDLLKKLPNLESLPMEDFVKQLNEKSNLRFALSEIKATPNEVKSRIIAGLSTPQGIHAIERVLDTINNIDFTKYRYAIIIDNGVIRFVEIEEASDFWENWIAEYIKNHSEEYNL